LYWYAACVDGLSAGHKLHDHVARLNTLGRDVPVIGLQPFRSGIRGCLIGAATETER
jgi:hypothetical protein